MGYATPKKKHFRRLRGDLIANGLSNADLCKIMRRGECYVSRCLNAKVPFNLDEQYAIMNAINRPFRDLYIIFPPDGNDDLIDKPAASAAEKER